MGMTNPVRDKNEGRYRGGAGRGGDTCDDDCLSRKPLRVKTSSDELSWRLYVMVVFGLLLFVYRVSK